MKPMLALIMEFSLYRLIESILRMYIALLLNDRYTEIRTRRDVVSGQQFHS